MEDNLKGRTELVLFKRKKKKETRIGLDTRRAVFFLDEGMGIKF